MFSASTYQRVLLATLIGGLVLAGCETEPPFDPAGLQIAVYEGDNQVGAAGWTLSVPLAVRVTDPMGRPVPNVTIRWAVGESGGRVSPFASPSVTDHSGTASVTRTLGDMAGAHTTTARIDAQPDRFVSFTSIAQVQGATQMVLGPGDHGNDQADTVLTTLAPYRVLVLDHNDAPVSGVQVFWTRPHSGSLSSTSSTTDANGIAQVTHTLGTRAGSQYVEASVYGLIGSPVRYQATTHPGEPTGIAKTAGDEGVGVVATALTYGVAATDSHGNRVSGITIDWAVTTGGGSISPSESVGDPVAFAVHSLGPDEGTYSVTATASGIVGTPRVMFTTRAVTRQISITVDAEDEYLCQYWGLCTLVFNPPNVVVPAGRTVGWVWDSGDACNVAFQDDPTEPTSSATKTSGTHFRTFTTPGTYRYRCTLHSTSFTEGMVGLVTVR